MDSFNGKAGTVIPGQTNEITSAATSTDTSTVSTTYIDKKTMTTTKPPGQEYFDWPLYLNYTILFLEPSDHDLGFILGLSLGLGIPTIVSIVVIIVFYRTQINTTWQTVRSYF